jgi:aminoglycoside phosphotransferase (APT) family kinase protein
MALTSQKDVEEYIKTSKTIGLDPNDTYTLQELSGGTANFVFRLTSTAAGTTSIIKHAEPFVRSNPAIKLPTDRMDFEAKALEIMPSVLPHNHVVQPAPFLGYDPVANMLHIGDGGAENLKEAYTNNSSLQIGAVGRRLGQWLAALHKSTASTNIGDAKTAKAICRFSYINLAAALQEYGHDPILGEEINKQFGSLLATDDSSVCHGDFWPGNVLVRTDPLRLTVVDWEMTRRGNGATDVGQFAAEAWLLDRFRGGKGLLQAFLESYCEAKGKDWPMVFRIRVAVHFATHICYWPTRVPWGNREETAKCVEFGAAILQHVWSLDDKFLREGALAPLFPYR